MRETFERIASDVNRHVDDVRLEVEHLTQAEGDEARFRTMLDARVADGTVADLVHLRGWTWQALAARGALQPLGELAARDRWTLPWPRDEAYESQTQFRGKRYLSPSSAAPLVIYFRRDHFMQADVPLPRPDWSYLEFQDAARRLTRRAAGRQMYGYLPSPGYVRNVPWWRMHGGAEWDRIAEPRKASWNAPAVVEAFQYQLYDSQYTLQIAPPQALVRRDPSYARLDAGGVAMTLDGPSALWRLDATPFDVQLLPSGKRGRKAHVNPLEGQLMTKNSKDRDAAWEVLKWIAAEDGQRRVAESGQLCNVPEHARRLWLPLARSRAAGVDAFVRAMEGSTYALTGEISEQVFDRDAGLAAALTAISAGQVTAKDALERLQPRMQQVLDRYWEAESRL